MTREGMGFKSKESLRDEGKRYALKEQNRPQGRDFAEGYLCLMRDAVYPLPDERREMDIDNLKN